MTKKIEKCNCSRSWPRLQIRKSKYRVVCAYCGRQTAYGKTLEEAIQNWDKETEELVAIWGRR